jgi:hypothetical protein
MTQYWPSLRPWTIWHFLLIKPTSTTDVHTSVSCHCEGLHVHRSWWKLLFTFGQAVSSQFVAHFASWPMIWAGESPFFGSFWTTSLCQEKNPGARFGQGSPWVAAPGTSKAHQSTFVPTATWCNGMAQPRYKVGQNLQLKPGDTCYDISYDSGSFTLPSQTGPSGVWPVPNSGRRLANTLTITDARPGARPRFPSDQDCQIHPNIQYVGAVWVPQIT